MEIYILRHGIAEPAAAAGARDADRALTKEGKQKLRVVLKRAAAAGVEPTLILTSPLRRAVETAELAAEVLGYSGELLETGALEPARDPESVWEELRLHKNAQAVLLSGHEPQLSAVVAYLLGTPALRVNMRKGALVRIAMEEFGAHPRGILEWMLTVKLAGADS